jgi:hypothetical protein
MGKNNVVELKGRDELIDPLSELLVTGTRQLIAQAVEAELQELMERYSGRRTEGGKAAVVRNGYLPERNLQTRPGSGDGQDPQGPLKDRGTPNLPLGPGTALCQKDQIPGSGFAVAVSQGRIEWRNGRGTEGSGWPGCRGPVGQHGLPPEAGVG